MRTFIKRTPEYKEGKGGGENVAIGTISRGPTGKHSVRMIQQKANISKHDHIMEFFRYRKTK